MGRPKGSKNKLKDLVEEPRETVKEPVLAPVKEEPKDWKPEPDMGNVQPPAPTNLLCKDCGHKGAMHYGGQKGWCNTQNCKCNELAS
jgi:hypothetical protein